MSLTTQTLKGRVQMAMENLPNPILLAMAEEFRTLDAEAKTAPDNQADAIIELAVNLLRAISETPAQSPADVLVKMELAAEAFTLTQTVEDWLDNSEAITKCLAPEFLAARRFAAGEARRTVNPGCGRMTMRRPTYFLSSAGMASTGRYYSS